jgi:hypothetical protein
MIEFLIEAVIEFVGEMVLEFFSWLWVRIRYLKPGSTRGPVRVPGRPVLLVLLAVSALFLCPGQESQVCNAQTKPIHPAGENTGWPEQYTFIHENSSGNRSWDEILQSLPFERIELERRGCYGWCPIYTVTLFRDGNARYHGEGFVKNMGDFSGSLDPFSFGRLCYLFERLGFSEFEREYSAPWTCSPTVYLRVWRAGEAEPIVVKDYGEYSPIELWGLQQAVDAVATRIEWKAAK